MTDTTELNQSETFPGKWEVYDLNSFKARRRALLRMLEADFRLILKNAEAVLEVSSVHRYQLDDIHKIRLLRIVWTATSQAAEGTKAGRVGAYVIAGPAWVARLAGDFTNIGNGTAGFFENARRMFGGDDIVKLLKQSQFGADNLAERLSTIIASLPEDQGVEMVGVSVRWPRSTTSPQRGQLAYKSEYITADYEWRPEFFRKLEDYERRQTFYERLIAASKDADAAHAEAAQAFEEREKAQPWQILLSQDGHSAEGFAFTDRAERDLVGFAPPLEGDPVTIRAIPLPFYDRAKLVELVDRRSGYPRMSRFVAFHNTEGGVMRYNSVRPVDYTSLPMHRTNAEQNIRLTSQTVRPYLKYFCHSLRAQEGLFKVIESSAELNWMGLDATPRRRADEFIKAMTLWTPEGVVTDDQGTTGFLVSANVIYANRLAHSVFLVNQDGIVMMLDDDALGFRLPIVPEMLSEKTHFVHLARSEGDR